MVYTRSIYFIRKVVNGIPVNVANKTRLYYATLNTACTSIHVEHSSHDDDDAVTIVR